MVNQIRDQAQQEAELLPPALARLEQLQATIEAMQAQINTLQSQIKPLQQLPQQQLDQAQRLEEQRALLMKLGAIATRIDKQTRPKEKKWMPWTS